ncbi:MAG: galactose-1-phosphate uridylyltransferase [Candidatus Portnoybacteria bacterium CG_4_8_14_3_um_filter_44_10]|uniref:Galactose-1-phosphate uridylyltransferase n=3 Tax=Candidatus Portnoyibacteriota TaxID=1817913 RepID=A0A2H0KTJ7_9BACT|nr:MAG: galactose-1-phosphate uridylyltransferase [Candidatus Portnoybacteria bacterium CG11_big_fil_rev_8_21_14_0_20_44_10]PIW75530.1 MAG: galactose-1-phosphate uridylyltransferase [Candidatus Portnoybacteria bacterium CG_4_8_14_3_um_filter_44_10]PJA63313.1 MAG: galactose-1-phosphate uridylyltransferase [Candidatus Portnoybacteria bacterium CG_4_9_14_3_um_filter_44_9]
MSQEVNENKPASELRFNLVCKDWVVIATGRAKRPETFARDKSEREQDTSRDNCPFCDLGTQALPVLEYKNQAGEWTLAVVSNKFPAFSLGESLRERAEGPYSLMDGLGFHEVVVLRDHDRHISELSVPEIAQLLHAYQERYLELMNEKFVNYVSIFHNYGREAGASIYHPHSQIIAIPIIDPDLQRSLNGSRQFFEMQGRCVHCAIIEWDREDKRRIVFENEHFVVLCPFASKVAFEVRIYPKEHRSYFERIKNGEQESLAEALKVALGKIYKALNDPPFNFFIHTSPCDGKDYAHYHWHLVIFPKTSVWAGFELGAGIEISTIEPEKAAEYLRGI